MKIVTITMIVVALGVQSSLSRAAMFTSSSTLNQSFNSQIGFSSSLVSPALDVNMFQSGAASLSSGVSSVSVTADTQTDKGYVHGMQFKPFTMSPITRAQSASISRIVVDVPADFPIPAVTHVEQQVFSDSFKITGITATTPSLGSSTMDNLKPLYNFAPWFVLDNTVTLVLPSIFVQGTYEAKGPIESRSVAFNVEFIPVTSPTFAQHTGIQGGAGFNNGFSFSLVRDMFVRYQAVTPVFFDEQVDGVQFRASFTSNQIFVRLLLGKHFPEPGAMMLMAGAGLVFAGTTRLRVA